jgi:putative tricarboxylic transport membrane protein
MYTKLLWSVSGGLAVAVLGASVALISASYPVGTLGRMGPGFLPLVVGVVMLVLGLLIAISDVRSGAVTEEEVKLRPFVAVFAAIIAWVEIVPRFGLVPATVALVVIAAFAQRQPRILATVVTALVLSFLGVAIFIWGLGARLEAVRF